MPDLNILAQSLKHADMTKFTDSENEIHLQK